MLKHNSKFLSLSEVLHRINTDTSLLKGVFKYNADSPLDKVFKFAFDPKKKWLLPEGVPPYTECMADSPDKAPEDVLVVIMRDRLSVFANPEIEQSTRERIFIQTLEKITSADAKVLLAIKDQNLTGLYKNITRTVLEDAGYIEPIAEGSATTKSAPTKTRRTRTTTTGDKTPVRRGRPRKTQTTTPSTPTEE